MNKAELVSEIAKDSGLTKVETEQLLNILLDTIKDALQKDEKVTLVGFGTFQTYTKKPTTGINPKTKEKINIPAKKVAKLKFSDSINDMLNK